MTYLLVCLALAALAYQMVALLCLRRFFRRPLSAALSGSWPGVTLFKPVRGLESETRECLASFLHQDYPTFQVLFGVSEAADPVVEALRELKEGSPQEVEIIFCDRRLSHNPKVNVLRQLEPHARHEVWVVADGDVKVGRDFLAVAVAALKEQGGGLLSCPYRAGRADTLGARLEALTISADFIPSVAVAHYVEGVRFALGAAMVFHRDDLRRLGGFAALGDYLADDYQLGWQMHQAGRKVTLLPYVVETANPQMSLKDYLLHQLRWARTYRVCRPKGYLAYGITHALVWSLAAWLAAGTPALGLVAAALVGRGVVAFFSERLCLRGSLPAWTFLLLPIKDLVAFGLWLLSFVGNEVTWRGSRFRLSREGLLSPLD